VERQGRSSYREGGPRNTAAPEALARRRPGRSDAIIRLMLVGFNVLRSRFVLLYSPPTMPRDGALILSEVRVPVLSVVCEPCGRRERYDVERLMRQYGWDAKLTDLLPALVADCPKRRSVSVYDRCKAVELCRKIGDGVNQAADLISATASIPSLNFIPLTTFGNWF
jgi:hypothetical protein